MIQPTFDATDAEYLLGRPEFMRFMFLAIQSAGMLGHRADAHGPDARDFFEGRRSLGLELLKVVDAGQPVPLQTSEALVTLSNILSESINPKGKTRGRRTEPKPDRYDELRDGGDDHRRGSDDDYDGSDD